MRLEKKATLFASIVATLLAIFKLIVGIISGSVAVLASAIDSLLDVSISIFNYFALNTAEKDHDEQFNFGRGKIEAIASVIEGVIITFSGLYILYISIMKIINQDTINYLDKSIMVMIVSIIATGGLVFYLNYVAKKTNSMVIKADSLHYKTDLYSNIAIVVSLVVIHFTGFYLVDAIMGLFISIYIIYSAYELIHDGVLMLLDVALDEEKVEQIKTIIKEEKGVTSYHDLRTRQSGSDIFVSVHLVFNDKILLVDAHEVSDEVEDKIKKIDTQYTWYFSMHLDPFNDALH